MDSNDHLKWIIGDMAFQIANLNAKVEELEAKLKEAPRLVKMPVSEDSK